MDYYEAIAGDINQFESNELQITWITSKKNYKIFIEYFNKGLILLKKRIELNEGKCSYLEAEKAADKAERAALKAKKADPDLFEEFCKSSPFVGKNPWVFSI